jgi:hypothetical protein
LTKGKLYLKPIISHRLPFEELPQARAFQLLTKRADEAILGIMTFQ